VTLLMGVVADDVTGANDIGIMFAKWGYRVHVYDHDALAPVARDAPDICIVNTIRPGDGQTLRQVYAATKALQTSAAAFSKKNCSSFAATSAWNLKPCSTLARVSPCVLESKNGARRQCHP